LYISFFISILIFPKIRVGHMSPPHLLASMVTLIY
jgi:hypothetical protein